MKDLCSALMIGLMVMASASAQDISKSNESLRVTAEKPVGNVSNVNGAIRLEDGVRAKDISTVNGTIAIGRDAAVGSIEAINGEISVDEGVTARSIESINGKISLAGKVRIEGNVTAVNGAIRLAPGSYVGGTVDTENGLIALDHATVNGDLRTSSGDIEVGAGSIVKGEIFVEKPGFTWFRTPREPRIVIGPGAVVTGPLTFARKVSLYVSDSAKVGSIEGAKAIKFSGAQPERGMNMQVEK